ncbi:pyridoxamine 5'-phosphate oxidase [Ruminiclostridium hungatei]|uniref:Pyridoxamine 5'-phosphate oxidase n=1 Tax=Ruminiclostridium hungatei TaxID=48256 RepID=A0A1V4SPY2_RUMHU|nr:pyridoxamine 5'-phosphate oxidase family protein [Ruminiclostridium hungatei]OPX45922.1 pyridoxamine 5'-phosphate oxidase [Ruminiclostridium hungatei]
MEEIRYKQRICSDQTKIEKFLTDSRVGTLGMCDLEGKPYSIPVNYVYWKGSIYIHGMGSGKKNHILIKNPQVCFNIFEELGTVADNVPSKCDTAYFSVMIFGKAELVEDMEEKTQALSQLMNKFLPGFFKDKLSRQFVEKYHSALDNMEVAVHKILPLELTAKENPADMEHMFKAGSRQG